MSKKRIAIVVGTRPEVVKCAPVIRALNSSPVFTPLVIFTGQHDTMAEQAFSSLGVAPDIRLNLMQKDQTPLSFLGLALNALEGCFKAENLYGVLVQGDTSSALAGALVAHHLQLPCGHIEAGLRTFLRYSPFPEEMNRTLISELSVLHFCPTEGARNNLLAQGVLHGLHTVGNTVVDALFFMREEIRTGRINIDPLVADICKKKAPLVLVTGHRRENFDGPIERLCNALIEIHAAYPECEIVYPVHLNPRVSSTVNKLLKDSPGITLLEPLDYPSLLALIEHATLVITDSGGIQEEAPSFGTPVLVTRESTERPEAIDTGAAKLTPLAEETALVTEAVTILKAPPARPLEPKNPFGDGKASSRIVEILTSEWREQADLLK